MKRIDAYGISRTRDKKGVIIKQEPKEWTMCGGGWDTMAVLVLEVFKEKDMAKHYRIRKLTSRE